MSNKTPDKIWLIDMGDEWAWCDTSDPDSHENEAVAYVKASTKRESGESPVGLLQIIKNAFFEGFGIGDVMASEEAIEGFWQHSQAKADIPPLLLDTDIEDAEPR